MKKALTVLAIIGMLAIIAWCNGCAKPKQVAATAPAFECPARSLVLDASVTGKRTCSPPCPEGYEPQSFVARYLPGSQHGLSSQGTLLIQYAHGMLECKAK
jgi:hypothetical protein